MSTLDFRDLPEDRLASTDAEGRRLWIIPLPVQGIWKKRKTLFHHFLLVIFLLTPWLRWNGSPLVLFDVQNRQFIFFGKVFASHDAPLMFFILGILGFGLIIATALWGRIWCGWACPQTVFIEQVFRRIEFLVVGSRAKQIECSQNPLKLHNMIRLAFKWILFVAASLLISHSFMAYFVSWEKLSAMMAQPPAQSWWVFLITFFITAVVLFDFAWFREQFCIIMCPYGRFQSVLMDQNTITVSYDYRRGETRGKGLTKAPGQGDCVDCFKCVAVCPTGIDIRRGQQLECIGCTACIDACDEVMTKIHRPKGLIRYAALSDIEKKGRRFFRPRLVLYFAVMAFLCLGFVISLLNHQSYFVAVHRERQKPYVVTGTELMNNFKIHIKNPTLETVTYEVVLLDSEVQMYPPALRGELAANQDMHLPFFLKQTQNLAKPRVDLEIHVRFKNKDKVIDKVYPVRMLGPGVDH